jgi:very-short-patch-repair endonuclease
LARKSSLAALSRLSAPSLGVFRGRAAIDLGVTRNQIAALRREGVIERVLPDTYRMTAVQRSSEQSLRAALLWAGPAAAAAGRSAGALYRLEGVAATLPEIVVPRSHHARSTAVIVSRPERAAALMLRRRWGVRVTGVEPTLVALAAALDGEAFEVACEDARRRQLTSVSSLRSYLERFGASGRDGVAPARALLDEIDPVHPARSALEVKTRRLLVAGGLTNFVREFPLQWNGRTYRFDFAFERECTILETNGRRRHGDTTDYERDNEKWSVPGRLGYRIVFATWNKVTREPHRLLAEIATTLAA